MNKKELKTLIEQIVHEQVVGMSKAYMFKEQIMKRVQEGLIAEEENVSSQADFTHVLENEIEKVRSDMDLTFDMVSRSLGNVPFEIFYKAFKPK